MTEQGRLEELSLEQRVSKMEWLLRLFGALSGLSLVGILAAFSLGSVNAKVTASSETINRVYGAVAENRDSLLVRTNVIKHRLSNVEKRLDAIKTKLNNLETRLSSVESKLDKLIELHGRR